MMIVIRLFRLWLGIILTTYAIYLALNNTDRMVIQVPPFVSQISLPVYIIAGVFLLVGSFMTMIFIGIDLFKKTLMIRRLKKQLQKLEAGSLSTETLKEAVPLQPEIRI